MHCHPLGGGGGVRIKDPTAFHGSWRVNAKNYPNFVFENDGTSCPTLQFPVNGYNWGVDTVGEATRAAIGSLTASGRFRKLGEGELKLIYPNELGSTCELSAGTLALGRVPAQMPDGLAEGFIFHLDAQAEDTLGTESGPDGHEHVVRWQQPETEARAMGPCEGWPTPRLVTVNGRKMVDFGAHAKANGAYYKTGEDAVLGPAAALYTASSVGPVREAFFVAEVTTDSGEKVAPFGGGYSYAWQLNSDIAAKREFAGGQGDVAAGDWRLDGVHKRCKNDSTKHRVAVYSVQGWFAQTTTGTLATRAFNCLAFSGPGNGSVGGLRLGEVVAYSRELSENERMATQRYLMNKWHDGSERQSWDLGTLAVQDSAAAVRVEAGEVAKVRRVFGGLGAGSDKAETTLTKKGAGTLVVEETYPQTMPIVVQDGAIAFTSTIARDAITDDAPASGAALHLDGARPETFVMDGDGVTKWVDCEGRTTYVDRKAAEDVEVEGVKVKMEYALPTVAEAGVEGYKCLDFGDFKDFGACLLYGDSSSGKDTRVDTWKAHVTEAFVVWKRNPGAANARAPLFAADNWVFVGFDGQVWSEGNAGASVQGANLSINGQFMYGNRGFGAITAGSGFNVYNISYGSQPLPINGLARWVNRAAGGCQIAEYISYQRPLTDQERRNTIAYLMKKWGKGEIADRQIPAVGPITYADANAAPKIGTDSPRTVASVTVEGGAKPLVKTGPGKLTVGTLANVSGLVVEDGAVAVTDSGPQTLAALHVPASQFAAAAEPLVTVAGTLTLAEAGELTVSLPETFPGYGRYPLVQAGTLVGDVEGWSVKVVGRRRGALTFVVEGNVLSAVLSRRGSAIIIR